MTYRSFAEGYEMSRDGPKKGQRLQRWKRIDGHVYIKKREKLQAVVPSPKFRADDQNADFCFAEMFMDIPWRDIKELPSTDKQCIEEFARLRSGQNDAFTDRANALCERQRRLDDLSTVHQVVEALPIPDWAVHDEDSKCDDFVPMQPGSTESGANTCDEMERDCTQTHRLFQPRRPYTLSDIARAEAFITDEVRPYMKKKKDFVASTERRKDDGTFVDTFRYPIDQRDVMNDDQWVPFALSMKQARKRHDAMIQGVDCPPMRMILSGEGGSGKSWLIKHIVKDVHQVFGESNVSVRKSKRVLLMAHQGTAAFNIKGSTCVISTSQFKEWDEHYGKICIMYAILKVKIEERKIQNGSKFCVAYDGKRQHKAM